MNDLHLIWEELNRIVLLGTSRAEFSPIMLSRLRSLGIPVEDTSDSKIVLEAITTFAMLKKITPQLRIFEGALPQKIDLGSEGAYLPTKYIAIFNKIIDGYTGALTEFSILAQQRKWKLPAFISPLALDLVLQRTTYWDALAPLLDASAWWLIEQNKDWQFLKILPFQPLERPLERITKANNYLHAVANGRQLSHQEGIEHAYWFEISQYDKHLEEEWYRAAANDYNRSYTMKAITQILVFRKNMHVEFDGD